ncbi:hypothetical protein [Olsenella intestinalis]|uniref:hypothetical protein n=1 Tax=Olsenella intestinalis TaxID=2930083 RepID=UPI00200BBEEB|nr:hypothetical protein [Olsenella intestinalis]
MVLRSAPQIARLASKKLKEGDATAVELLRPAVSKIRPDVAVSLLEDACSSDCDISLSCVDELHKLFCTFEFTSGALAIAMGYGNSAIARYLIDRGANLQCEVNPLTNDSKGDRRARVYLNRFTDSVDYAKLVSGQGCRISVYSYALSSVKCFHKHFPESLDVCRSLASEGLLPLDDVKGLACEALLQLHEYSSGMIGVSHFANGHRRASAFRCLAYDLLRLLSNNGVSLGFLADFLSPLTSGEVISVVGRLAPELIKPAYTQAFLRAQTDAFSRMLPFLDYGSIKQKSMAIRNLCAVSDYDAIRSLVAYWGSELSRRDVMSALNAVSDCEDAEGKAFLLSIMDELPVEGSTTLEL